MSKLLSSRKVGFDISYKLSPRKVICMKCQYIFTSRKIICMKCQSLFSKKNKSKCRQLICFPSMLSVNIKCSRCQYDIRISRITNAFARRDRDVSNAETISKVSCETERAMSLTSFSSTGPVGRLSRKDVFEHKEITSRRDLFEAMLELCK